ncbi:MAG: hypothetical protein HQL50_10985 [Magnetococcales bacterium]|nr:hypothetical protein [Magnetococcales bacterium]
MKKSIQEKLVVELDGATFLVRWRSAQHLEKTLEVSGDKWVISDFGGAPPEMISVDAPPKYADVIVQRRVVERGDAGDRPKIIPIWAKGRSGGTSSDVLFSAIPGSDFARYDNDVQEDDSHHLLFSSNAVLYACLAHFSRKKTVCVLFEHDRHVDLLIGRDGNVIHAGRVSAYATDEEAKQALVSSIQDEMERVSEEARLTIEKIVYFCWLTGASEEQSLSTAPSFATFGSSTQSEDETQNTQSTGWATQEGDSMSPEQSRFMAASWVRTLAEGRDLSCTILKPKLYDLQGGEFLVSSLPQAVRYLNDGLTSSGSNPLLKYRSQRLLPRAMLVIWLMVFGLYWGGLWFQQNINDMNMEIVSYENKIGNVETVDPVRGNYKKNVDFADRLAKLKKSPSYKVVLDDLTRANKTGVEFNRVRIDYVKSVLVLTLEGRINEEFEQASRDHEVFLNGMTGRGYQIVSSNYKTDVQNLTFTVKMNRVPR